MCTSSPAIDLTRALPRRLITEIARLLHHRPWALQHLKSMIDSNDNESDAVVAGILLAADPHWAPRFRRPANLSHAHLYAAHWPRVYLSFSELMHANLTKSDLTSANLDHARAGVTQFGSAIFIGASMKQIRA